MNNESAKKWWECGRHVRQKEPKNVNQRTPSELLRGMCAENHQQRAHGYTHAHAGYPLSLFLTPASCSSGTRKRMVRARARARPRVRVGARVNVKVRASKIAAKAAAKRVAR